MVIEKRGNIFTTQAQTIVNTVNCVGIMGAGIAYEFRLRHHDMFTKYQTLCDNKQITIGKLWIYKSKEKNILNFPTKKDWKFPSKEEYLTKGLEKFVATYKQKGITSIAFPLLGADKGGLKPEKSLEIMTKYLSQCDIDVEIWHFDPTAEDDLYNNFKNIFLSLEEDVIKKESKIRADILKKIKNALQIPEINSLSGLLRVKGVGDRSLEKLFIYIDNYKKEKTLFDF
ncbi:macro domain-containing protein [Sulfurimonas hydrogeniphila]|uniref:macro domain-containing protein n=1 Tax=Sulfurimonas hydrogeniphila TaxID=2509341 RepID=UPI00125F784E|nr:macro domain-containing protein [Sulfurimonas hydrogeniphila]